MHAIALHPLPRYDLKMTTVINLRTLRKQAARDQKRSTANANAAKHGRTKAQRDAEVVQSDKARAHLDAHKREPGQ